jgi:hypothetical protein
MVDALRAARRIVVSGGVLLDTRPVAPPGHKATLEVVSQAGAWLAGEIDESPGAEHDRACQQALDEVCAEGWLVPERQAQFDSCFYWPTEADFEIGSHRHVQPGEGIRRRAGALLEEHRGSRLRLKNLVSMARYRISSGGRAALLPGNRQVAT